MRHTNILISFLTAFLLCGVLPTQGQTFNYTGAAVPIPDASCPTQTTLDINVAGVGMLGMDVILQEICFDINHTFTGDLEISLVGPTGITIPLTTDNGGGGDNYTGTCLAMDGADGDIFNGVAPFTGTFIPEGDFADFLNTSADGIWSLSVCDDAGADLGTVLSWSITFDQLFMTDVGVVEITSPNTSCNLGTAELITVVIENFGGSTISNIPVGYQVDGGSTIFDTFLGSIDPGNTASFTFIVPADLSVLGSTYSIDAFTALTGDQDATNDGVNKQVENIQPINTFPWTEDFETFQLCGNNFDPCDFDCDFAIANNWTQDAGEGDDWRVDEGPSPSGGTGPSMDHDPGTDTGNYLFLEGSGGCTGVTSNIITPCFDITALANPAIEFYIHMHGGQQGTMNLDISTDGGGTWTNLWTTSGELQTAETDPWLKQEVFLTGFTGGVFFRFQGITGAGFETDMALDAIKVFNKPDFDASVVSIDSPDSGCGLSDMETVSVTLTNLGGMDISNIPVEYQINGGGFITAGTFLGTITPGGTDVFTFDLDLSAVGVYDIDVRTTFPGDGEPTNDQASRTVENIAPITSFPWTEDFETFVECGNNFDPCPFDCEDVVDNNWVQDQTDDDDWRPDSGGTPSGGTGPAQDNNPGTPTGKYLFLEGSGACTNLTSRIISPCFDISGLANPHADFFIHMFGDQQGTMALNISDDDGATWTEIWTTSGQLQTADTDPWIEVSVPLLNAVPGNIVKLRWDGITGTGFETDMALDDIKVFDKPPFDVFVAEALSPIDACGLTANELLSVVIESNSNQDVSNIPVAYSVNGLPPVNETFVGTVSPGQQVTYDFINGPDLSTPGEYTIEVWTLLGTDGDNTNDTLTFTVQSIPLINTFPYNMDWEAGPMGWSAAQNGAGLASWELGEPNGPVINSAASGLNAWVTNLTGDYNINEVSYLVSPCLDFSALTADPNISFAIWWATEACCDEGWLEVSIDGENTWTKVGTNGTGENWYNDGFNDWWDGDSGGWVEAENVLTGTAGEADVRLRFVFSSDFSVNDDGFGIDEFSIKPPLPVDMELVAITGPGDDCGLGCETITLDFENVGTDPQSNIQMAYSVNGLPPVGDVFLGTINPGELVSFTFNQCADLSAPGDYTVQAWAQAAGEGDFTNDTASALIQNIPVISTFPYQMDFEMGQGGWTTAGAASSWELGMPNGAVINSPSSGQNAWVTNLDGAYNANENSFLISPCMDFTSLTDDPTVSFALWTDIEGFFDEAWLEVSIDGENTWTKVGTNGTGINWYNVGGGVDEWDGPTNGWVNASNILVGTAGEADVRLRFVFSSDVTVQLDGMGIDEFEIRPVLQFDAEVEPSIEYTQVPFRQAGTNLAALVTNLGQQDQTNVTVTFEVFDPMGVNVFTGTGNVATILPGEAAVVEPTTDFIANEVGTHTVTYTVTSDNDEFLNNNTLAGVPYEVGTTTYARDNGDVSDGTSLGIGPGGNDNAILGQNFEVQTTDNLAGITFRLEGPPVGDVIHAEVWNTNADGSPNTLIASTVDYTIDIADATGVELTLEMAAGPLTLGPGTYFLGVVEPDGNITLATLQNIFTPGTTWVNWDGNPFGPGFANNEAFNFNLSYFLRAEFDPCGPMAYMADANVSDETGDGASDGMIDIQITGGVGPFEYVWNTGQTTSMIDGLDDDTYSVTITDALGCIDSLMATVEQGCIVLQPVTIVIDETEIGANDGAIDLVPGPGTPPFSYIWDNGATTEDLENLEPGVYCVTINDAFGCEGNICAAVLEGCGPLGLVTDLVYETTSGAGDGSIDLTVGGGQAPFEYIWNTGATTEDIGGLSTGEYCVTVTDFFGCEEEVCESIFLVNIEEINSLDRFDVFPNPTSDLAIVDLVFNQQTDVQIDLINVLGQTVLSEFRNAVLNETRTLDLSSIAPGVYFVRIIVDGQSAAKQLIIAR
ncbi:MAG: T9SS type A sorting domain-containing protein [Bacteroidota bacterium]